MGVSLERVQFKFASIVGELCNDPDILSQFAVWLDLRLAEYKLKGAISLDCSGEEPDADWMNGLKKCKKCGSQQHQHGTSPQRARQHSNSSQKYSYQQSTSNPEIYPWDSGNSRLSPEVKSENQEVHVVPMELHMNSIRTNSLKRPRNADSWSHSRESPSKRPFMSSSSPSSDNQSLLSVIGGDVDSTNQNENDDDVIQVIEADTLQTSQHSHSDSRADNSPAETSMNNDQFLLESSQKSNTDSTSRQGTSQEDPNNIWVNQQGTSPTKDAESVSHVSKGAEPVNFGVDAQLDHFRAPYVCGVCGARYTLKSNLRRHERVHKPFSESSLHFNCPNCSKVFYRPDLLKAHISKRHDL